MILLKFETAINGEATVAGHDKWINVDSVQFGVGRSVTMVGGGGDRETSNPRFSEVTFTKSMDVASTEIMMQATCGKSLGNAEVHFIQTGGADAKGQVYFKIDMADVLISSYSASSGGERPSESFSLNFTKISLQYDKFDGDKITAGTAKKWDLEKNEKY